MKRSLALVATLLVLASGCGGDPSASDQVPELTNKLAAVDDAVAAHDDAATRRAVDDLMRTAMAARRSGDLDQARLDQITAAAEALQRALPRETRPTPTPTPTATPTEETKPEPAPKPPGKEKKDEHKPGKHGHEEHGHGDD